MKNEHQYYIKLVKKFHSLVDRSAGKEACWPWRGERSEYGIGLFPEIGIPKNLIPAHRMAYIVGHKVDPRGRRVNHNCGRRSCCNPKHLYLREQIGLWKDMSTMLEKNP